MNDYGLLHHPLCIPQKALRVENRKTSPHWQQKGPKWVEFVCKNVKHKCGAIGNNCHHPPTIRTTMLILTCDK